MFRYEYVTVVISGFWTGAADGSHRQIIDDYAKRGFRYSGYVPSKQDGYGKIKEIDLVFELHELE